MRFLLTLLIIAAVMYFFLSPLKVFLKPRARTKAARIVQAGLFAALIPGVRKPAGDGHQDH